jgi:hypothetical protein
MKGSYIRITPNLLFELVVFMVSYARLAHRQGNIHKYRYFCQFLQVNIVCSLISVTMPTYCRSQWSRGLRRGPAAVRLLELWVPIPPWSWMFISCDCCVLSGRGLCVDCLLVRRSPAECSVSCECDRKHYLESGRSDTEKYICLCPSFFLTSNIFFRFERVRLYTEFAVQNMF